MGSKLVSKFGFKLKLGQQVQKEEVEIAIKEVPTGENLDLSFMKLKPYPFQVHGIAYGIQNERVIIGDQPGRRLRAPNATAGITVGTEGDELGGKVPGRSGL